MSKLGLVLEGGGMRGIYTAGVPVMRAVMYPNRSAERTVPIPPI